MINNEVALERLVDSPLVLGQGEADLRDRDAFDAEGTKLGTVKALYVDTSERRLRFLEVTGGGILGIADRTILVPIEAVERYDDNGVYLARTDRPMRDAPAYDPQLVEQRSYWEGLYGWYGYPPYWSPTGIGTYPPR